MSTPLRQPLGVKRETKRRSKSAVEGPEKLTIRRPARVQLTPEETRARMEAFEAERAEAFIARVREDED